MTAQIGTPTTVRAQSSAIVLTVIAILTGMLFQGVTPARAASSANFSAGHLVSDAVFYNSSTMSEQQIQLFLNGKVQTCASGATCLKNFSMTTTSRAADAMCAAYDGAPSETAARIIYRVSQACGINPQVLLVMLQKEQGLVTSASPSAWAWQASMGYACPDSAPCDAQFFGFYNQVYKAAWQLKRYGNPPGTSQYFTWIPVGVVVNIAFHPNSACGSAPVYIANKATAALYYYTPYQPTTDALNAGYAASGNPCASYGNRNFVYYFTDWFGTTGSMGPTYIDILYQAMGGSAGDLGASQGDHVYLAVNGSGYVRAYVNGAIAWTQTSGAFALQGATRTAFNNAGGIGGSLGWPVSSQNPIGDNGGGTVQAFQGGAIASSPLGTFIVSGSLRTAYNAHGGIAGPLGWPTGNQSCSPQAVCTQGFQFGSISMNSTGATALSILPIETKYQSANTASVLGAVQGGATRVVGATVGYVQGYASGAITWTPEVGAHALRAEMRAAFNARGGVAGYLGWPVADETCDSSNSCSQRFEGGVITISNAQTSASMYGPIETYFTSHGGANGMLGAPVGGSNVVTSNGLSGVVQGFANAAIVSTPTLGTYALVGDIRSAYAVTGGLSGGLGWPTADSVSVPAGGGGIVQSFLNGRISGSPAGGFHVSKSPTLALYLQLNAESGALGWPTSSTTTVSPNGGGAVQGFQNGAITASTVTGTFYIQSEIRARYNTYGGLDGFLGWPTSNPNSLAVNGGGIAQGFQSGAITWTAQSGAIAVAGPIRVFYNQVGGVSGSLGWPAASASCTVAGVCTQGFQNGTIRWSAATGAEIVLP